jgi:alkyl hydroperoxide reductase subunit AhpF
LRLDKFLVFKGFVTSRNKAGELIKNNKVKINGKIVNKTSFDVNENDNIEIYFKGDIMKDLVIIGGGPAGLSAGLYASRMGIDTTIYEKLSPGGQITLSSEIENYPGVCDVKSGLELMQCWPEQAKRFGCIIESSEVKNIKKANNHFKIELFDKTIDSLSVIVATGASPKRAGFENEEEFIGKGISTCAVTRVKEDPVLPHPAQRRQNSWPRAHR